MSNKLDSLDQIIHKKKEAKKKQKATDQSPIDQLDNRTIGKNSTQDYNSQTPNAPGVDGLQDNRAASKSRTRNQVINFQIDEWLYNAEAEGLIEASFFAYYAKACHKLGISKMNQIAINARTGHKPSNLFAYKVKGALQLHFKREYDQLNREA